MIKRFDALFVTITEIQWDTKHPWNNVTLIECHLIQVGNQHGNIINCVWFIFDLLPLIMKLPVVRYSPDGAVLDTWSWCTHHALVTTLASHAALLHIAMAPTSFNDFGGIGSPVEDRDMSINLYNCKEIRIILFNSYNYYFF